MVPALVVEAIDDSAAEAIDELGSSDLNLRVFDECR
jgi:hypothetical protein